MPTRYLIAALLLLPCAAVVASASSTDPAADTDSNHQELLTDPVSSKPDSSKTETVPLWPVPLDTTYVHGQRLSRAEELLRGSSFATVINVARQRGPGEEASDLLERCTGVSVRQYGGPGSMATLSIRGMDPGHVEVFLDRVPLRTASQGMVDLGTLDLAHIESVEIYRSAPPFDLGGEASGAAIRLVTRVGGKRRLSLRTSTGSYGTVGAEALTSGAVRGARYLVSTSHFRTDGDFAYHSDNGTDQEPGDDSWQTWGNGDVLRESLYAGLSGRLANGLDLNWTSQFWRSEQGLPGTRRRPTREANLRTSGSLHRVELSAERRLLRSLDASLYSFAGWDHRHYRDPLREMAITGARREVNQEQDRHGVGAHLSWTWLGTPLTGIHVLEALVETRREHLREPPSSGEAQADRRTRSSSLLSLGDRLEFARGRLRAEASLRWEESHNNYTGSSSWGPFEALPEQRTSRRYPRLGIVAAPNKEHTLKANWTRHARYPTFVELFGYTGSVVGNPGLKPESSKRWDIGWVWTPRARPGGLELRTECVFYFSRIEEMIVFLTISDRETKPMNLDEASIQGSEFTCTLDHLPALNRFLGIAALTFRLEMQETRDEGVSPVYHGKQLTYHPPVRAGITTDLGNRRLQIRHTVRYQDGAYWGRSNLPEYRSEAYWNHDMLVRWRPAIWKVVVSLRVENAMDRRHEDIRGYPLPGRSWFGGIELDL